MLDTLHKKPTFIGHLDEMPDSDLIKRDISVCQPAWLIGLQQIKINLFQTIHKRPNNKVKLK